MREAIDKKIGIKKSGDFADLQLYLYIYIIIWVNRDFQTWYALCHQQFLVNIPIMFLR